MSILRKKIDRLTDLEKENVDSIELLELYDDAENNKEVISELEKNILELTEMIKKFDIQTVLSRSEDSNNAILSINSGAGGTEAQDWAEMICRMYLRYSELNNFKAEFLDKLDGDEAGIKNCTIFIKGDYAYGMLRNESGVHRLVRISPFDSNKRRHTSFASVSVLSLIHI